MNMAPSQPADGAWPVRPGPVVIIAFFAGDAVLEPAQGQAARADHAPVEIRPRQGAGVENEVAPRYGQFRDDAVGGGAEHGTRSGDVDSAARFQDAAAHHGFHRIAGAGADGDACGEARFHGIFFTERADDVPRLDNAGHIRFRDAQDFQLLRRPFLLDYVVAQAPAGHGAPVDEGVFPFEAGQVHEDIRAVVDELDALFLPGRDVLHEPAGEHGREHDVRFGIACFFPPDSEFLRLQASTSSAVRLSR